MKYVERRHAIAVEGAIERVLPMFTPLGEMAWVEGWTPEFIHPESGATQKGLIFRTGTGDDLTYWACIEWRRDEGSVGYSRVTPSSRSGFVEVRCKSVSPMVTGVEVSYAYAALTRAGEDYLEGFSGAFFSGMIEEWRAAVNRWLAKNCGTVVPH